MTQYDPKILQSYADHLYSRASVIVRQWLVKGVLIGLFIAVAPVVIIGLLKQIGPSESNIYLALVAGIIGGCIGYVKGQSRAFYLRFQAQEVLCQKQIEHNTHRD